jgi:hypothetical protein
VGRGVPKDGDDGETVSSVDGETSKEGRRAVRHERRRGFRSFGRRGTEDESVLLRVSLAGGREERGVGLYEMVSPPSNDSVHVGGQFHLVMRRRVDGFGFEGWGGASEGGGWRGAPGGFRRSEVRRGAVVAPLAGGASAERGTNARPEVILPG